MQKLIIPIPGMSKSTMPVLKFEQFSIRPGLLPFYVCTSVLIP